MFSGLEDKATACQMLVCYARELKEHFVEYAEQVIGKRTFINSDTVLKNTLRNALAQTLSDLLF